MSFFVDTYESGNTTIRQNEKLLLNLKSSYSWLKGRIIFNIFSGEKHLAEIFITRYIFTVKMGLKIFDWDKDFKLEKKKKILFAL